MRTMPETCLLRPFKCLAMTAFGWMAVSLLVLLPIAPILAQEHAPAAPSLLEKLAQTAAEGLRSKSRLLTPGDAKLRVSRDHVVIQTTNAYDPSGIRYLAIHLRFQNKHDSAVTVHVQTCQLIVGNVTVPRVQKPSDLNGMPIGLPGETTTDLKDMLGPDELVIPARVGRASAWMVFAPLPQNRDLPPLIVRLDTSAGPIDLDITRIENEALTSQLERMGPEGRMGIARIAGELNVINAPI